MGRHSSPVLLPTMPERPDIHESTVGIAAVDSITLGDWYDETADQYSRVGDVAQAEEALLHAERIYQKAPQAVQGVRAAVAELPNEPQYQAYFGGLIQRAMPSRRISRRTNVLDLITYPGPGLSDSEVLSISHAHLETIATQQHSPDVALAVEVEKRRYIDATVTAATTEGWLSPYAATSAQAISQTDVRVGDLWSTHLRGWQAFRPYGKNEIVVGQSLNPDVRSWPAEVASSIEQSGWHEFSHISNNDTWMPRWIKEPCAEYVSLALRFGYSDTLVDLETRPQDQLVYLGERALWDSLLTRGHYELPGKLLARAYSSENQDSAEWMELAQALDASWGTEGVLHKVDAFIQRNEAVLRASDSRLSERDIQRKSIAAVHDALSDDPQEIFGTPTAQQTDRLLGASALTS